MPPDHPTTPPKGEVVNLIEKIARVITARRGENPDDPGVIRQRGEPPRNAFKWQDQIGVASEVIRAIEQEHAILPRTPTETMLRAGAISTDTWAVLIDFAPKP